MKTLSRAIQSAHAVGDPIETPWHELNDLARLRTKELVIVAGAPGGGKSTLAINLAMGVDYPILYFAQDTPASVLARMVALATHVKTEDAYNQIRAGHRPDFRVRDTLVVEQGAMTTDGIERRVDALTEWLGHAPPLIVVDNMIDLRVEGRTHHDPTFYAEALPRLKQMAIQKNLCVMALHHVTRRSVDSDHGLGTRPIRMSDLLYAGEREARHVWGCYLKGDRTLCVQVLKQQDGMADPEGKVWVDLRWLPEYTRIP